MQVSLTSFRHSWLSPSFGGIFSTLFLSSFILIFLSPFFHLVSVFFSDDLNYVWISDASPIFTVWMPVDNTWRKSRKINCDQSGESVKNWNYVFQVRLPLDQGHVYWRLELSNCMKVRDAPISPSQPKPPPVLIIFIN